jgi:hypothetical protein
MGYELKCNYETPMSFYAYTYVTHSEMLRSYSEVSSVITLYSHRKVQVLLILW